MYRGAGARSRVLRLALLFIAFALDVVVGPPTLAQTADDRTVVVVANLLDRSVSCPVDVINNTMFADPAGYSVAGLYREASLGNVSLAGPVVGPFTIDVRSTDTCDLDRMTLAAEAQATAAGVDLTTYPRRVYVMPPNSCSGSGLGSLGGSPARAWVFACDVKGIYAHEVGHALGLNHAATPAGELGDMTDPMALANNSFPGLNAPHRHQLGGLGSSALQMVSQDGIYSVAPLALDPAMAGAPQVLMIAKPDTDDYYYLSYRGPIGFDTKIDSAFFDRLSVHRYPGDGSSSLTYRLAGLSDGQSLVDSANGITVTQVSHSPSLSTVSIRFDAVCTAGIPSLNVSPQAQSGGAGTPLSYAVAVTNTDSAICPASTLTLSTVVPGGWTGHLSPSSLTLSPGGTGQATLVVTSPPEVSAATYPAILNAIDAAQSVHTASIDIAYTVEQAPDTSAPTAPSGLTARLVPKTRQVQLSWNGASDNIGVTGYRVWKNGALGGYASSTTWLDAAVTAGNTYAYSVQADDAAGNVSASSGSATITVSSSGGGGKRR